MPALRHQEIIQALLRALEESGSSARLISSAAHPLKLAVDSPSGVCSAFIYIWTLTGGGRITLPNEYRVQMTGVTSPLATNPTGVTAIMGYEPNLQVFAGFDLARHRRFTTGSPSVQIDIDILRRALSDGLAFDRKTNDEIACGIRPDHVLAYLLTADRLHRYGRADYGLLVTAAAGVTLPKKEMKNISEPRRRTVQEVSSWSRDARFRNLVLQAYDRRCAITGLQLRLVDAAHILPVGAPGSTDHVNNGIALSPTYHRAYDRDLIYLDENYHARLNERKLDELRSLGLSQGIEQFREPLNRQIILPAVTGFRPSIEFIRQANALRRAAG